MGEGDDPARGREPPGLPDDPDDLRRLYREAAEVIDALGPAMAAIGRLRKLQKEVGRVGLGRDATFDRMFAEAEAEALRADATAEAVASRAGRLYAHLTRDEADRYQVESGNARLAGQAIEAAYAAIDRANTEAREGVTSPAAAEAKIQAAVAVLDEIRKRIDGTDPDRERYAALHRAAIRVQRAAADKLDEVERATIERGSPSAIAAERDAREREFADWLASKKQHQRAALVRYMIGKDRASFDDIKHHVHGDPHNTDGAVRTLASRTTTWAIKFKIPLEYRAPGGVVIKSWRPV